MGYIYMLIDTRNDKKYIGKHIGNDNKYWSGGLIPNRIAKKYGKDIFIRIILENDIPNNILNDKEIYYIKHHNSMKEGYNLTPGGDGGDTISNNPNKDIIINKIKETLKGRIFDDEHKKNLRENHMSKDPLNRKKLSEALKGKEKSEEHKKNLSKAASIYNKSIGRWVGDNNPLNNKEIKAYISKLNKERAYQRRRDNIKKFIYDLNNNLINSSNIKKFKNKIFAWKRDLSEYEYNKLLPKNKIEKFNQLSEKIKLENKKVNHFKGKKHSEKTKELIRMNANIRSEESKNLFFDFCGEIYKLMVDKKIDYLIDLYDKDKCAKIRKKIKSSKFLINLNDEIKERLLKLKQNNKKVELVPFYGNFYGNKNKKILIEGVKYNSISDASKKLNIDRGVIRYRLKSKNFLSYNYM